MRRRRRCRSCHEPGRRRPRAPCPPPPRGHEPPVPAADPAQLGDVASGPRRQRRRGRAGDRAARPRRAHRRPAKPADHDVRGPDDLRRARRRHDHVHGHRLLGRVRGGADPDVVLLPAACRAHTTRPGGDRRPRVPDRQRQLRPGRARRDRPPDQPVGRLRPRHHGALRTRPRRGTLGAFVALVQRAFESTQIGGILRRSCGGRTRSSTTSTPATRRPRTRAAPPPTPARGDHAHRPTGRHRRDRPRGAPARRRADRRLRGRRPGRGRVPRLGRVVLRISGAP